MTDAQKKKVVTLEGLKEYHDSVKPIEVPNNTLTAAIKAKVQKSPNSPLRLFSEGVSYLIYPVLFSSGLPIQYFYQDYENMVYVSVDWNDLSIDEDWHQIGSVKAANVTNQKRYLLGTTQQLDGVESSTNSGCYIGTDNKLYSRGKEVEVFDMFSCYFGEMFYLSCTTNVTFPSSNVLWGDILGVMSSRTVLRAEVGVLYHNVGSSTITVTVEAPDDNYITPNGTGFAITIPAGGYGEISVLRVCTNISHVISGATPQYEYFVRGI